MYHFVIVSNAKHVSTRRRDQKWQLFCSSMCVCVTFWHGFQSTKSQIFHIKWFSAKNSRTSFVNQVKLELCKYTEINPTSITQWRTLAMDNKFQQFVSFSRILWLKYIFKHNKNRNQLVGVSSTMAVTYHIFESSSSTHSIGLTCEKKGKFICVKMAANKIWNRST